MSAKVAAGGSTKARVLAGRCCRVGCHRRMFLDGLDMIGATLADRAGIDAFAAAHWHGQPWLKHVARRTFDRLQNTPETPHV